MKRVFLIILTAALLMSGCNKQEGSSRIKADNISIYYGVSSYAMFGADQEVIDDLLDRFNSLSFEKTIDEIDLGSAFSVNFSYNNSTVKSFWVDKNGVFWLDGDTQCYRISSGSFDYEHLKTIYKDSRRTPEGTAPQLWKDQKLQRFFRRWPADLIGDPGIVTIESI